MEYIAGLITGLALGVFFTILFTSGHTTLENCAKTHNVYQCEMVAVPVSGDLK